MMEPLQAVAVAVAVVVQVAELEGQAQLGNAECG